MYLVLRGAHSGDWPTHSPGLETLKSPDLELVGREGEVNSSIILFKLTEYIQLPLEDRKQMRCCHG